MKKEQSCIEKRMLVLSTYSGNYYMVVGRLSVKKPICGTLARTLL